VIACISCCYIINFLLHLLVFSELPVVYFIVVTWVLVVSYAWSLWAAPSDFEHTFQVNSLCPWYYNYCVILFKADSLDSNAYKYDFHISLYIICAFVIYNLKPGECICVMTKR